MGRKYGSTSISFEFTQNRKVKFPTMMHLSSCLATIAVYRTSASNYIRRSSKNSRWRLFGEHQSSSTPKGAENPTSYTTKMSCRSSRKSEKQRKFKCSYSLKAINLIIYQKSANSKKKKKKKS